MEGNERFQCGRGMIAAFDVHYFKDSRARAAAVLFHSYGANSAVAQYTAVTHQAADYRPGFFYLRELPCILNLLDRFVFPPTEIIIDGYVTLDDRAGMGQHLFEALNRAIPVIGVAKNRFHCATGEEVLRGESRNPLYVTAAGMDHKRAAAKIKSMHGKYRLPTLLKAVDQLARGTENSK